MTVARWMAAGIILVAAVGVVRAGPIRDRRELDRVNAHLHGQVLDYTCNHGQDHRIWSAAMKQQRSLYVYLPPDYEPGVPYPLAYWLHMGRQDEKAFLDGIVQTFDAAIRCGLLPPLIVVAPDGSFDGEPPLLTAGSFFINSRAGNFEDFVVHDVWEFVTGHFAVRPEREAHVLMGASMGGFAACNLGFKHPDRFKVLAGIFPPLNIRWVDCHGKYKSNFDPCCWGWREKFRPYELVTCYRGVPVFMKHFTDPIYGRGPQVTELASRENPIEMLAAYDVKPGQFDMFVGYGGKDELNIDAQVESFLNVAHERGLQVDGSYLPRGRHDQETLLKLLPDLFRWLTPKIAPYAPAPAE